MQKTDVLIIGGGISGCAAAQELRANGIDYLLLEKNVVLGGLTRSISLGDAHFDYTGHFLHLSRCNSPEEIPYAKQNNEDWQLIKRNSVVYLEGSIVPAPLQYNLYALPQKILHRCISDFNQKPQNKELKSFKDYLLSGFGQEMCDIFLFPYNEKILATDLSELSLNAVKRFFPLPDKEKIENGFSEKKEAEPQGYNSLFWYPKRNGIGILAKGLEEGLHLRKACCPVIGVNLDNKVAYTSSGETRYQKLITSIPLKAFCLLSNNSSLHSLASLLTHNRVLCVNLFLKGDFSQKFKGCHWIYVPDKNIPFYRVGVYSHIPDTLVTNNHTSVYVELAYPAGADLPELNSTLDDVFYWLEKLQWVYRKNCLAIAANWIDCAYVLFNHAWEETVEKIKEILLEYDVYPVGRYGLWDYISMEDSIFSGIDTVKGLIND
jgi:protoporphyrinogen oxidase